MSAWDTRRQDKTNPISDAASLGRGKVIATERIGDLLRAMLRPGDRVLLEGDNQKQADFLSRAWRTPTRSAFMTCTC